MIFVREPLERLLAGYQMVFNHPNVTKQNYDLFIRPILNKVRFEGKSVMPKSPVEAWEKAWFHGLFMIYNNPISCFRGQQRSTAVARTRDICIQCRKLESFVTT